MEYYHNTMVDYKQKQKKEEKKGLMKLLSQPQKKIAKNPINVPGVNNDTRRSLKYMIQEVDHEYHNALNEMRENHINPIDFYSLVKNGE